MVRTFARAFRAGLVFAVAASLLTVGALTGAAAESPPVWSVQRPPSGSPLYGIDFVDAEHGWAVGSGGVVLATADGGATWTEQRAEAGMTLRSVDFVDLDHGWAVSEEGEILATVDGGSSWTVQMANDDPGVLFFSVAFADDLHGWAVGWHSIFATSDGGEHWVAQTPASSQYLFAVASIDASRACIVGNWGTTMWTDDGGSHWNPGEGGALDSALFAVTFADHGHGWAVGKFGKVFTTADAGAHWTEQPGTSGFLQGVAFCDADHGWVVGAGGAVYSTVDGGGHWTSEPTVSSEILGVAFADASHGWAVTRDGAVLAYRPAQEGGIRTHTLMYSAGNGGTIAGTTPQAVSEGASGTPVTAEPDVGYRFVGWSDGVDTTWRTDRVEMSGLEVTATFALNPPPPATPYTPIAPSTVYRGRSCTVYGYVAPAHSSGAYLVQLNLYLKNSRGVYVYHSHVHARRYYYSHTKTKYKASISLPHRGKWRVRAYHSDAAHSASYSGYRYVTVK